MGEPPPIHWEETIVLNHGRGQEPLVKQALQIPMTRSEKVLSRDEGLEVPGCWTTMMGRQGGRSNPYKPLTSNDVFRNAWLYTSSILFTLLHFHPDDD